MFKVGDLVWTHRHGWGRVYRIDEGYKFCVNVDFKDLVGDFTADGKYSDGDLMGSLFFEELIIPKSAITRPNWKSEDGGIFYYVTEYGDIHDGRQDESNFAKRMWEVGNYFKTWKLAQESKFFKMYQD